FLRISCPQAEDGAFSEGRDLFKLEFLRISCPQAEDGAFSEGRDLFKLEFLRISCPQVEDGAFYFPKCKLRRGRSVHKTNKRKTLIRQLPKNGSRNRD
ncbi:MAG: hypothetical protein KJ592_01895, partial [Nanoarchaeota archaeon]|nr:hypothetical protein [Nanoarchaeota archaeon]